MVVLDIAVRINMKKLELIIVILLLYSISSISGTIRKDSCYIKSQLDYDYIIIEGYRFLVNDNIDMAENIYRSAIKYGNCGAAAYFQLSKICTAKNDLDEAEIFAENAYEIGKDEVYLLNYLNILEKTDKKDKAIEIVSNVLKFGSNSENIIYEYLNMLIQDEKFRKVKKELIKYRAYLSEDLYNRVNVMYDLKREDYNNILEKLNNTNITYENYLRIKAKVFYETQKYDSLKTLIFEVKELNDVFKRPVASEIVFNSNEKYYEILNELIFINIDDKNFVRWIIPFIIAEKDSSILKNLHLEKTICRLKNSVYKENDLLYNATLADYYEKVGLTDSLISRLEALRDFDERNFSLYYKLIQIYLQKNWWSKVIEVCNDAKKYFNNDKRINYFIGLAFYQLNDYQNARNYLESCLSSYVNDDFNNIVKALLAEVYNKLRLYNLSDSLYEDVIKCSSNDLVSRNNYAYYLSLRNEKLELAEKISRYTIEMEKRNASFYDTYAWILFKMGKFRRAQRYIEKAIKLNASNSIFWDHYGDIVYKRGRKGYAIECWKRSSNLNNSFLNIEEKIKSLNN